MVCGARTGLWRAEISSCSLLLLLFQKMSPRTLEGHRYPIMPTTMSSGQLSPAEDGLDSGLSSNGTTPPPQARRLTNSTSISASSSSTGEAETMSEADESDTSPLGSTCSTSDSLSRRRHRRRRTRQHVVSEDEDYDDEEDAMTAATSLANSPPPPIDLKSAVVGLSLSDALASTMTLTDSSAGGAAGDVTPPLTPSAVAALPPPEDFRDSSASETQPVSTVTSSTKYTPRSPIIGQHYP